MDVDIVTQYCIFNDYPLFRGEIAKHRDKFKKVILYPSRHHGVTDLEAFSREMFPETWVDPVKIDFGKEDWRQAETIPSLKYSDAEWIWFREQDFFVDNWEEFYRKIEEAMEDADAIGMWNPTHFPYLHPCCLFIKRSVLEKTGKDFRAHPDIPGCDHFAMITRGLEDIRAKIVKLEDLGYEEWKNCFHLGGLTYPYQDWKGDGTDIFGVKNVEAFYVYNYWSRRSPVEQSPEYIKLSLSVEQTLKARFSNLDPDNNQWRKYFEI